MITAYQRVQVRLIWQVYKHVSSNLVKRRSLTDVRVQFVVVVRIVLLEDSRRDDSPLAHRQRGVPATLLTRHQVFLLRSTAKINHKGRTTPSNLKSRAELQLNHQREEISTCHTTRYPPSPSKCAFSAVRPFGSQPLSLSASPLPAIPRTRTVTQYHGSEYRPGHAQRQAVNTASPTAASRNTQREAKRGRADVSVLATAVAVPCSAKSTAVWMCASSACRRATSWNPHAVYDSQEHTAVIARCDGPPQTPQRVQTRACHGDRQTH